MRNSGILVLLAAFALAFGVITPNAAHATSDYDSSYQGATNLHTSSTVSGYACSSTDITYDWSSYLTDPSNWYGTSDHSADSSSFLAAKADVTNGAWGVSQYSNGSVAEVEFWWTEDSSAHLDWSADGVDITTTTAGVNIHIADIVCQNYYYGGGPSTPP